MTLTAVVRTADDPADVEPFLEELRTLGVEPRFERLPVTRGAEWFEQWWWVLAVEPFVQHLVEQFTDEAQERLRAAVRRTLSRRRASRQGPPPPLILKDGRLRIELEADLPAEAYRALFEAVRPGLEGRMSYDRERAEWVVSDDEP